MLSAVEVDVAVHRVGVRTVGQGVARHLRIGFRLADERMPLVLRLDEFFKAARVDGKIVEVDTIEAADHTKAEAEGGQSDATHAFAETVVFFHDVVMFKVR